MQLAEMDYRTFDGIRKLVYRESGISLSDHKQALVSARVGKRMRQLGISRYQTYLQLVEREDCGDELVRMVDAISTNVTSFFREPRHFVFVHELVSRLLDEGQRDFRIWSAACSTGEEPYSLAMVLSETGRTLGTDMRILATDISTDALAQARAGRYPAAKFQDMPPAFRDRYFRPERRSGESFEVKQRLRRLICFERINLAAPPFPMSGPFDLILCRNVMIYFDKSVRERLLDEIYRLLRPGGYLIVGHAESVNATSGRFTTVSPSIYTRGRR